MRSLPFIILILVVGGAVYLRFQQPKDWNRLLDSLRADDGKLAESDAGSDSDATAPPPPRPTPAQAEYISPSATNVINSPHVAVVDQPAQPTPPDSPAPLPGQPPQQPTNVFTPPYPLPAQPGWVWVTREGDIFKDVVVTKVEADRVTITHQEGNAVIEISSLPGEIQKQLNYDPTLAAQAADERRKAVTNSPVP